MSTFIGSRLRTCLNPLQMCQPQSGQGEEEYLAVGCKLATLDVVTGSEKDAPLHETQREMMKRTRGPEHNQRWRNINIKTASNEQEAVQ